MAFPVACKVPNLGFFCATYNTPLQGARLTIRLGLARRLLMPGLAAWTRTAARFKGVMWGVALCPSRGFD
jgi:hypothetical protein